MESLQTKCVYLDFYNPTYKDSLVDYHLLENQKAFTKTPIEALKFCEQDQERHPILIFYNEKPVGFFVLHEGEGTKEFSDHHDAILLRAYSINSVFQGKGIATQSLRLIPNFIKKYYPNINEVVLAVNHQNFAAQHVYKSCGFVDTGRRAVGRSGEMYIYSLNLASNNECTE
ncbi:GNAT family N-acetyltransferase [Heyndrickxia ginsengihumi]|uniref:GNAT family N-acetyltransferase n=1 Tax=Heyndrickxia ginsengihumi TaxID=363870 RepID=UPI0004726626|nr:GNAT family N-acetyltransferase [Heyndrickxia ginsengihumi]